MATVIGVRFKNAGKLYFFHPGSLWPSAGDYVIVETARGVEFGEVVTGVREIDDDQIIAPLKQVIRIASADDIQHAQENEKNEREAYAVCQRKIAEHKLDMKLVSVEYTFDNSKILFYFTANGRVDFRSLVKDLASVFKTRIELRQIGVRDEAKMLGGLGPCGRPICCGTFLGDFQPVSIKMAKEQNLSLNPTKISGVCGRLMCCLKYEQDNYELTRKRMPKVGKEVIVPDGRGVVWDVNVIKETVRVRIQKGDSSELKDYPMADVQRAAQQSQGAPDTNQAVSRDDNDTGPETEMRPPRKVRSVKPVEDTAVEKRPASVSPWLAAVDHAMRAANIKDDDLPEEFLDGAGEDEDFTLTEEETEENPDDLLNFPDLMEEAPDIGPDIGHDIGTETAPDIAPVTGNEEEEQP